MKRLIISCLTWCLLLGAAIAQSTQTPFATRAPAAGIAVLDCVEQFAIEDAHCIVRLPIGATFEGISTDSEAAFEFIPRTNSKFPNAVNMSSTLIILDTSVGLRALARSRHFDREKEVIKTFLAALPDGGKIALATFHEQGSLEIRQDFTALPSRIEGALDKIELEGLSTHISEAVRDAVTVLAQQGGSLSKNVIVFSDGEEEGVDATNEVRAYAEANGVSVSAIAISLRAQGSTEASLATNYLKRLTDAKFGVFAAIQTSRNPLNADDLSDVGAVGTDLAQSIVRSGLVVSEGRFNTAQVAVEVNEPLAGYSGVTKPVAYSATAINPTYEPQEPEAVDKGMSEPVTPFPTTADGGASGAFDFMTLVQDYSYLIIGAAVALLLMITILVLSLSGGKKKDAKVKEEPATPSASATKIEFSEPTGGAMAAAATPALAHLHVKGTQQRLDITRGSVTVGRSAPSDVCIDHPSVSRQHIALRLSTNGAFLSDLNSTNGTKVDGKRVTREVEIRSGGVIALGKCEVIFSLA